MERQSPGSSNLCGHREGLSEGWASLRVLGRQGHLRTLPPNSSICRFSLNPIFGPPLTPTLPSAPKVLQKAPTPTQWGSCLAARGQVDPGGRGSLAAPHVDCLDQFLLSAPNLGFHGAGGIPEPLQGSGGRFGCLLAPPSGNT